MESSDTDTETYSSTKTRFVIDIEVIIILCVIDRVFLNRTKSIIQAWFVRGLQSCTSQILLSKMRSEDLLRELFEHSQKGIGLHWHS